tara:strand:- start:4081 stop:4353 length:273 start_codon:yes stop_codon:yes gene_type:complete
MNENTHTGKYSALDTTVEYIDRKYMARLMYPTINWSLQKKKDKKDWKVKLRQPVIDLISELKRNPSFEDVAGTVHVDTQYATVKFKVNPE